MLTDGQHTLTVKQTTLSGGTSAASVGLVVTVDTTPPAVPTTLDLTSGSDSGASSKDNLTSVSTPIFVGSAEPASVVTLYDGGVAIGAGKTDEFGAWSIQSAQLAGGAHMIRARAVDAAGNLSPATSALTVTIDAAAPGASSTPDLTDASDSGVSITDNITNVNRPTFTGLAEAGASVTLYDGTTVIGVGKADLFGAWSIMSVLVRDGLHDIQAKTTDAAGNVAALSSALRVRIDTTVPGWLDTPDLVDISDKGGSNTDNITNDTTPTVSGINADPGAAIVLYDTDGAIALGGTKADAAGTWSITSRELADGVHMLIVKQTDLAGNSSAASTALAVKIDTTAPAAPGRPDLTAASDSGASSTDNITNVSAPTFTGSVEAGAAVKLYDNGLLVGTGQGDLLGRWSIAVGPLADGTHSIVARATDAAGNQGPGTAALTIVVDTARPTAPDAPDLTAASDHGASSVDNITNENKPSFSGLAEAGSTVMLFDGTTVIGTGRANAEGAWMIGSGILGDGLHDIQVRTVDVAGNTSAPSAVQQIRIDTTVPNRPDMPNLIDSMDSGSSATDNITNVTTLTFDGLADANAAITLYDGATVIGTGLTDGGGNWSVKAGTLSSGVHLIRARVADRAGNNSLYSGSLKVVIDTQAGAAPVIGKVTISNIYGTAAPDSVITLFDGLNIISTGLANKSGNWILPVAISPGQHTFTATAADLAGNLSPVSTKVSALIGSLGNDLLADSADVTRMAGGEGNDTYYVSNSTDIVMEAPGEGTDTIFASVAYALATDSRIEFLRANAGSVGLALTGNETANAIDGNVGDDTLRGGGGADVLTGGGGQKLYIIATLSDSTVAASGRDLITDFSVAAGDRIDVHFLDADTTVGLDQKFTFIGTSGFEGIAGQLRYTDFGTATGISGDVNGDAVADFAILLSGSQTLTASNFIL